MPGRSLTPIVVALSLLFLGACKKKESAETQPTEATEATAEVPADAAAPAQPAVSSEAAPREVLPGAADVRAALERKDYANAVGGLLTLKAFLATQEQIIEYGTLYGEVKSTLMNESTTDIKAAQALATLRAATIGR